MVRTPIGRVRLTGLIEGTSFLVLLGIAMPLKYAADMPEAVSVVGMLHGILFVMYLIAIGYAFFVRHLTFMKSLLAVGAAFVPLGPFLLDKKLR